MEQDNAKRTGGKRQPASGALWHSKGDTKGGIFLDDTKDKLDQKSFSFTFDLFEKLRREAIDAGKIPRLVIYYRDKLGKTKRLAIMDAEVVEGAFEEDVQ